MRFFIGMAIAGLLCLAANAAESLLRNDFTSHVREASRDLTATGGGSYRGVLDTAWSENYASWNSAQASGEVVTEGGRKFFRLRVTRLPAFGSPQFRCDSPTLEPGNAYRLTLRCRNRTEEPLSLVYRQVKAPYREYWSGKFPPSDGWTTWTRPVAVTQLPDAQAAWYLLVPGIGTVDLEELKLEKLSPQDADGHTFLDTRFYEASPVASKKGKGEFSGVLPEPWQEDYTHWNDAVSTTAVYNLGAHYFLQFTTRHGAPQFLCPLPPLSGHDFKLSVYARNASPEPVRLTLRMRDEPYTPYGTAVIPPDSPWTRHEFELNTGETPSLPPALLLNLDGPGIFEISSLKLESLPPGSASPVIRPAKGENNFFRNSRLPLGLQSGWNFTRSGFSGSADADPEVIGPSGSPALKLTSRNDGRAGIASEPFSVHADRSRHTVSFACRGTGNFQASVVSEGKSYGQLNLPRSDSWQRVSFEFDSPAFLRAFTLRVEGTGTVWLDAFRAAEPGDTGYRSAERPEVALALPDTPHADCRIQFRDEPAEIRYRVTGLPGENARLRLSVTDLYGNSQILPPVPVDAGNREGKVTFPLPAGRELGQFRVEAQLFRENIPVSPVNELVVTRLERPVYEDRDAPDSPFGIHTQADPYRVKTLKAGGVNHVRLHDAGTEYTGWFHLEPKRGEWKFRDADLQVYRDHHLSIFGQLGTAPRWASYLSKADTGRAVPSYHDRYFQPLDLKDFRHYVDTVCTRYRGVIREWFVWNEPWNVAWWAVGYDRNSSANGGYITSREPRKDFAALNRSAWECAKAVDPESKIVGTWTETDPNPPPYEIIDFHFYTDRLLGYPGDGAELTWREKIPAFPPGARRPDVYMTEGQGASQPTISGDVSLRYAGIYKATVPWKNEEDHRSLSDRNIRFLVSLQSLGVKRIFLYSSHTFDDLARAPQFLVLLQADGFPHPMLAAHSAYARRVEGKQFVKAFSPGPGLWIYLFRGEGKTLGVCAPRPEAAGKRFDCALPEVSGSDLYGNRLPLPAELPREVFYLETAATPEELEQAVRFAP